MTTPLTPPDVAASGLLTTKPQEAVLARADIDPAMLAGPRSGARRCSLTLLPLCTPVHGGDESGRGFPDAHAHAPLSPHPLRMHAVPNSTLLPFLQRPHEVTALLCDARNATLLNALKASPAWPEVQRILPMQRNEVSDARWLAQLQSALGERGQHLCNDLMRCLGAQDVSLEDYLDAAEDAMDTDSDSEHEVPQQTHDTFASDESDEEREDEETQHDEPMSTSEHSLATSTPALSVEALHAVPDGWVGPQRTAFAAASQQAASASPSSDTASSAASSRPALGTLDWSGSHHRRSSVARSLPDIQEEGVTPMLEKSAPSKFTQQVDDKLESQMTSSGESTVEPHARHRRLSTSLDDAPREEIENILESGVVGLRFVTDMPPFDEEVSAHKVPAPATTTSLTASASTPAATPHFQQHRRLSALFAPMTSNASPPPTGVNKSFSNVSPRTMRSRSSSLAHSEAGEDEHKGMRGVPLSSRRRLSFARSFAELAETRDCSSTSNDSTDNGNGGPMRRRHSTLSRTADDSSGARALRRRSNTTCGYAQEANGASQLPVSRAKAQPISALQEGVSLSERAAALEAAGEEKPSWLGLLPDGRTRHPSAGSSKAGNAGLEAFRASLGMARADSEAGSSAAGSGSGTNSPLPSTTMTKEKEVSKEASSARAQTSVRASPPAPLPTLPRKRSGSGGMGLKSPPMQPATPLAPLLTPKRSSPSPTEASGFALGGGFSFKKSGEHYKPSPAAPASSDDVFDLSSPSFCTSGTGTAATAGSSTHSPVIHRRKGGFTAFSREYEKTQRARRMRAASATSVDSTAYSTGSQVVASDDESEVFSPLGASQALGAQSQDNKALSYSPVVPSLGSEAPSPGARVTALGLSGMGSASSPALPLSPAVPPSPVKDGRSAPLNIPSRSASHDEGRPSLALSSDAIAPRRPSAAELSTRGEKHVAWQLPSISDSTGQSWPLSPADAASSGSAHVSAVRASSQEATRPSETLSTIIFPIAPAHSRAVEMARMLRHPRASSALERARSVVGADAVSHAVLLLSTTERSALSDTALLERLARETFGLVDHASRASAEADEKLCEEGYAERWEAFERFAKEACAVDDNVVKEAKARCGPALCLFSSSVKGEHVDSNPKQKEDA